MKLFSKFALCAATFATAALYAAETINITDPAFMRIVLGKGSVANNQIKHTGKAYFFAKKNFPIDAAKKYIFKYTIVNNSDKVMTVYAGLDFHDAKNKTYPSWCWQTNSATLTEVIADAKKGDTELKVKNGAAWIKHPASNIVKTDKDDCSDIPIDQNQQIAGNIIKITKEDANWVFTLQNPLKSDIAAGTKIRQHFISGYYYLPGSSPARIAPKQSRTFISTVSGYQTVHGRFNQKYWPANAKAATFLLLSDYADTKGEVIIKDASITIE